jgi:hypothetical protein
MRCTGPAKQLKEENSTNFSPNPVPTALGRVQDQRMVARGRKTQPDLDLSTNGHSWRPTTQFSTAKVMDLRKAAVVDNKERKRQKKLL